MAPGERITVRHRRASRPRLADQGHLATISAAAWTAAAEGAQVLHRAPLRRIVLIGD